MAPRRPAPPPFPQPTVQTLDQMRRGIDRINKRIADLEAFDPQSVQKRWPPEVEALQNSIEEALTVAFGHNSIEYKRYEGAARLDNGPVTMRVNLYGHDTSHQDAHEARQFLAEGKQASLVLLRQAVRGLEEEIAERESAAEPPDVRREPQRNLSKVFVVHGHDGEARQTVARFIEKLGFEAVILHERPNNGRTIITKFREEAAGVGFAVVLMTPDDVGGTALGHAAPPVRARARQNVVFELGFFIGELGPARVAALVKGEIERPSDFDGVVYIDLDDGGAWKMMLAREFREAGLSFDANKVFG
jgi:predicted nucleotide-binding protein